MTEFGAYSEVGKLRKVIVHRPGLEMRRLTPTNAAELLFDDVIWSRMARAHHDEFVQLMRDDYGITVYRVHELLKDVVDDPVGRAYILDRKLVPDEVGVRGLTELRAWMDELDSAALVEPPHRRRGRVRAAPRSAPVAGAGLLTVGFRAGAAAEPALRP